jgi:hypothetical protein
LGHAKWDQDHGGKREQWEFCIHRVFLGIMVVRAVCLL